jgi:hypothetical protein
MRDDIRLASQELLAAIRGWFESHGTAWAVSDAAVDEDGQHKTDAGIRLQAVSSMSTCTASELCVLMLLLPSG